jgi:glycosyltransferase involved in cell wall biosynthesis
VSIPASSFDIAITTYKRPDLALAATRSCLAQNARLLRRVIVVDDASKDDTASRLAALGDARVVVYERPTNGGIGAARFDALSRSEADWTVSIDSDHELLPGALDVFARLASAAGPNVGILGARYHWDTGRVTPRNIPPGVIDYRERILWTCRPESLGTDYVSCVSRAVREKVAWSSRRSVLTDSLYQLDAVRVSNAVFAPECVAYQKSNAAEGNTRGSARHRLRRRRLDAADGVELTRAILERHGDALWRWGRPWLRDVLRLGAVFALLLGRRRLSIEWALMSLKADPTALGLGLAAACLAGPRAFSAGYRLRDFLQRKGAASR